MRAYDKLFQGAVLEKFRATNRPRVSILATSLISGDVCAFTPEGLIENYTTDRKEVEFRNCLSRSQSQRPLRFLRFSRPCSLIVPAWVSLAQRCSSGKFCRMVACLTILASKLPCSLRKKRELHRQRRFRDFSR